MIVTLDKMVQVGMHFGHQTGKWNPKMSPYIYKKKNGIHIIDLVQTLVYLSDASVFLKKAAAEGKTFLFVGTKKQATRLIEKTALECNSFFVNQRWLGGMLTNWQTIKKSINKLNNLDSLEKRNEFLKLPKKEAALIKKEKERLEKYLGGLKTMSALPDIVIIVGQLEELNAVYECKKLGIQNVTILDTNCDPTLADVIIPANDDSVNSLELILNEFLKAIKTGQKQFYEIKKNKNILFSTVKKK